MRILFLSRWLPYPPDNGSKIRILNVLRQLAKQHDVSLVTLGEPKRASDPEVMRALGALCTQVHVLPYREFRPSSPRALAGFLSPEPRFLVDTYQPEVSAVILDQVRSHRPDVVVASQI